MAGLFFRVGAVVLLAGLGAAGESPEPGGSAPVRAEVRQLVAQLDADSYSARRLALERLERLAASPDARTIVGEEVARLLRSADISLEVRHHLARLQRDLPPPSDRAVPAGGVSTGEIQVLLGRLEDESYAVRSGAATRLEWLLNDPDAAGPVLAGLRGRMARADLSADARQWLDPLWQQAWGIWLATDPAPDDLAPVSQQQIERWIDALAGSPGPAQGHEAAQAVRDAQRQLRDVLVRDDHVDRVRRAIETRLGAAPPGPGGAERLAELADLCRPGMVAEFWQQRHHRGIQYLVVGVPSQTPGAPRPSHFDRIDDQTAHCVSGSNLAPGDYPVGVAVPHPNQTDALFHLVNLSTPRRRMAYESLVKRDPAQRLAELSRRTCQRLLRLKEPLAEEELYMLAQLDAREMSQFAGKFLLEVPDGPLPAEKDADADADESDSGRPSRHGMLCAVLAGEGTREAVPGLLEAIGRRRLLAPTEDAPYAWDWIAALAIAVRDPWPEVDPWLGSLIGRPEPLAVGQADGPELGATAAAILLERHGRAPTHHGLEPARDGTLERLKLPLHRFASPEAREALVKWWEEQKTLRKAAG